jgi:hypothetical protein
VAATLSSLWNQQPTTPRLVEPLSWGNFSSSCASDKNPPPWAYMLSLYQHAQAAHQYNNIQFAPEITSSSKASVDHSGTKTDNYSSPPRHEKKKKTEAECLAYSKLINRARVSLL